MMKHRCALWWSSLGLCTFGWILLLPLYSDLPPWLGMIFFALAVAAGVAASESATDSAPMKRHPVAAVLLAVAAAGACFSASWGLRAALALLTSGLLLVATGLVRESCRRISRVLLAVGAIAVAQGASVGMYATLVGDVHAAPVLSFFDIGLLRVLGRSVSVVGQTLYVSTMTGPVAVMPSWDQVGLAVGLILWIGFALLVFASMPASPSHRIRLVARGSVVIALYLLVRHVLLLLVALETGSPRLFWNPTVLCLSIVPLIALLARYSGLRPRGIGVQLRRHAFSSRRTALLAGAAAFVGTVTLLSALYLIPAGVTREGIILFDEAHGDWESTRVPMSTDVYGMATTYNYASLADWLSYYYPVGQLTQPIDESSLESCAALVLKTPSVPYSQEEIGVLDAFVTRGGGLFVIGDHTNVFGTATTLNPVLARFGLALNYDSTYRLKSGSFTTFAPSRPCFDPIMQHVERFDFLTSCSIRAPLSAYRVIADDRVLSNQADYATRDFFPRERYNLQSQFGRFTQAASVLHGSGRVVLFTDSTCFSNFSVFMDGYPSFLLGTFTFLLRENVRCPFRGVALVLAGMAVAALGALVLRRREHAIAAILTGLCLGWTMFAIGACLLHASSYPLPRPAEDIPFVYFDIEYSDIEIEPQPASAETYDRTRQFDTFFVWTQRIRRIPQLVSGDSRDHVLPGRAYTIINPQPEVDAEFLGWIHEYVVNGGTMILIDRCGRDPRGSGGLLRLFGLELAGSCGRERVLAGSSVTTYEISPSLTLAVSVASIGGGQVVLVSDSSPFSNLSLGGAFTVPSEIQEELYEVWFDLLQEAVR